MYRTLSTRPEFFAEYYLQFSEPVVGMRDVVRIAIEAVKKLYARLLTSS